MKNSIDNPCGYGIDPQATKEDIIEYYQQEITKLERKLERTKKVIDGKNRQIKDLRGQVDKLREDYNADIDPNNHN